MKLTNFIYKSTSYEEEVPYNLDREDFPYDIPDDVWKKWKKNKWKSGEEMDNLFKKYCNENNFHQVDREVLDYDLEKSYETVRIIFSFKDKYYAYTFDSSPFQDYCDYIEQDRELIEVVPETKEYTIKKIIWNKK